MNNQIKYIATNHAPQAVGPYAQAVTIGHLVFCSGQIGMYPKTGQLVEGVEKQTKQALTNLKAVLKAAGSDVTKVVKTTVFLTNINDFPVMNKIYEQFFSNHKPARSTVEVSHLPKGALVEIDAIAIKAVKP